RDPKRWPRQSSAQVSMQHSGIRQKLGSPSWEIIGMGWQVYPSRLHCMSSVQMTAQLSKYPLAPMQATPPAGSHWGSSMTTRVASSGSEHGLLQYPPGSS